ncbi:peptidoglycan DD-metalloendopeptidase family protein [Oceanobacillus sp. FSL H7-0719]|uniref:peptidoglycan DD-metalloendopeptidase family protein n=1 Tax=Oceanobacillus sp. FSL H7-0719 TaxID=2954507 RepID=UPI0032509B4A
MNEENKFGPKKSWTRIFRKKWFFPSLYLMLAALLLSAVVWYQNSGDEQTETVKEGTQQSEDYNPIATDGDAVPVMEHQELILLPVLDMDEAEIVTKFFDYNADEAEKANALIHYNNRYYQSTGIDIASSNAESFDVVAAISGTVKEVKKDPIMGNVVTISHENDVTTYYASLDEVSVKQDAKIKQGDVIGTAGKNIFGKDKGIHVHFELRKADEIMNPEEYFNQPVANLYESAEEVTDDAINETEADEATDEAEEVTEPESAPEDGAEEDADLEEEADTDADADPDLEESTDTDADEDTTEEPESEE